MERNGRIDRSKHSFWEWKWNKWHMAQIGKQVINSYFERLCVGHVLGRVVIDACTITRGFYLFSNIWIRRIWRRVDYFDCVQLCGYERENWKKKFQRNGIFIINVNVSGFEIFLSIYDFFLLTTLLLVWYWMSECTRGAQFRCVRCVNGLIESAKPNRCK